MLIRLTPIGAMTDNSPVEAHTTLDRLRVEAGELRASRKRLVLAADADRRSIERELHEGVHQHLVALAVNLQLASRLTDTDAPAAQALIAQMAHDVQQALAEAAQLAQRIYPPLLEAGGLAAALRAAAERIGIRVSLAVAVRENVPPEVSGAIYWCCLDAFELAGRHAAVTVTHAVGTVAFEIVVDAEGDVPRDRVDALDGQLLIRADTGGGTRIAGMLPVPR
jgi:signal transduction histidine kinase